MGKFKPSKFSITSYFNLITFIDKKIVELPTCGECGLYINYDIMDDDSIVINYGYSGYEEGDDNNIIITFNEDNIKVDKNSGGHSVMGGDFEDIEILYFQSDTQLIDWLNNEF